MFIGKLAINKYKKFEEKKKTQICSSPLINCKIPEFKVSMSLYLFIIDYYYYILNLFHCPMLKLLQKLLFQ